MPEHLWLEVIAGDELGREVIVPPEGASFGRNQQADQIISERHISRRHFHIGQEGGRWILRDLGSQNGTFVNDARVEQVELKAGDVIRVGRCQLRVAQAGDMYAGEALRRGEQIGQYEILSTVGRGSIATVYLARHTSQARTVALKVLPIVIGITNVDRKRFLQEASVGLEHSHRSLAKVYDAGETENFFYIAMEYIEGQTLLTQVRQSGPLSHENALRVAMNLVDALALLHSNKIIHRDIRPSNVLLGFDKRVVLVDLGLLKSVAETNFSRLTRTGNAAGDPRYQAPDLVLDIRTEDTRCDIYALGATLYFAVTGRQPFDSRNMMQLIRMVMNDMPPPPVELRPRLPGPMNNLILKAMAKDPSDRFQSMREMAQVLAGLSRT